MPYYQPYPDYIIEAIITYALAYVNVTESLE